MVTQQQLLLTEQTWDVVLARPKLRSWDVICEHVRLPKGEPFNGLDYPYCRGIAEEFDNPARREIVMQTSARVGKTTIALALMVAAIGQNPDDALFSTANKQLAQQTVRDKIIPMLRHCDLTRDGVPPDSELLKTSLHLRHFNWYVGWSGSPVSLGDIGPRYSLANELDKWDKSKSDEADPLELFTERGLENINGKQIMETTPTVTGISRINKKLLAGTNCRFQVPCPKCKKYQQLVMGVVGEDGGSLEEGGILFDKLAGGKLDADLAFNTARYICRWCGGEIHDEQRRPIIRKGIWVPHGQYLTKTGKLRGHATHNGPTASFQLSRLYSPTFTFGDIARKFVAVQGDYEAQRNFQNSWMGETFTPMVSNARWDELAAKLCGKYPAAIVPQGGIFLTCGVDVQVDHLVYMVFAWGLEARGWCIHYGIATSWEDLKKNVLDRTYKHADEGPGLPICMTLVDSRYDLESVETFCKSVNRMHRNVWPLMGAKPGGLQGRPFSRLDLDDPMRARAKKRQGFAGIYRIMVNTNFWQGWLDNCLYRRKPDGPSGIMFPAAAFEDQDLFEQLLNEVRDEEKMLWVPVAEDFPWDFRDCTRYARCGAEVRLNGNWQRLVARDMQVLQAQRDRKKRQTPALTMPDGRPYLVTER